MRRAVPLRMLEAYILTVTVFTYLLPTYPRRQAAREGFI